MRILITGANGYLGSLLYYDLMKNYHVIATSKSQSSNLNIVQLDIRDKAKVISLILQYSPNIIIHAAAYANVSDCEKNPEIAQDINVNGTLNVVEAADLIGAKVIFISSLASNSPTTVYGKTKFHAERVIQDAKCESKILQLSMTFGLSPNTVNHRPFNKIIRTLRTGQPDIYDNTWRFQPTYSQHFLLIINMILKKWNCNNTIKVVVDKQCTMFSLASEILPKSCKIIEGTSYKERQEILVDHQEINKAGYPSLRYETMIKELRDELTTFQ